MLDKIQRFGSNPEKQEMTITATDGDEGYNLFITFNPGFTEPQNVLQERLLDIAKVLISSFGAHGSTVNIVSKH